MATKFVRVRLANGEASVSAEYAELHGLKPLKNKRAARNGTALPPKYTLNPKPPAPADTTKE